MSTLPVDLMERADAAERELEQRCRVVAILQNQWFKDPERVRGYMDGPNRTVWIRRFLFMGCRTGERLRAAFGEDACENLILWEEASRHIGGHSASAFPPDPAHILAVIGAVRPAVILAFGKIAQRGVGEACGRFDEGPAWFAEWANGQRGEPFEVQVIHAPHPTARHATVPAELAGAARRMRAILGT